MREIKFRAIATDQIHTIDKGDWVYGLLSVNNSMLVKIDDNSGVSYVQVPIDPKTVGQYTGSKDGENGKEIYEDDIIADYNDELMIVKFGEYEKTDEYIIEGNGWYIMYLDDSRIEPINSLCIAFKEIIGNVHDNPELIEEY